MSVSGLAVGTVGNDRLSLTSLNLVEGHSKKLVEFRTEKTIQSGYEMATRAHQFAKEAVKVRFSPEAMAKVKGEVFAAKAPDESYEQE